MRKSSNLESSPYRQQDQQQQYSQDEDQDQYSDQSKKKKQNPIPRFIKNQIAEIDTDIIVLNISRTQYQVVEQVGRQLGWKIQSSKKSQKWDIMWIDSHIEAHDLFKLNQHQKISHFPAIYVLTRKNFLGRSLMKMRNYFPEQYSFFPSTWSIPADFTQLLRFDQKLDKTQGNQFYIYKPQALAQGKGIKLFQNVQLMQGKNGIVQKYINNPYLIENLKFDLRIYVLIMGYDPLRIFIYDEGLGRFATQKYQKAKKKNMKDVHMHLTNYAINKNNKNFIFNDSQKQMDKGHKRSLSAIYNYLKSKGINIENLKKKIDQMIIKTLIVGQPMIAHTYGLAQADNNANDLCFQILGFDVLINDQLEPILLEVNHTPSFKTDTPLDKFIKKNLIKDTLQLLNVNVQNKKQKVQSKIQFLELRSQRKLTKMTNQQKQEIRKKKWKQRDQFQQSNLGNFRKIFPTKQSTKYKQMIEISNKIFNQANGIKNKSVNHKLSYTIRPKSFEKPKIGQISPLITSIKQKFPSKFDSKQLKNIKLRQNQLENQTIYKNIRDSTQKFPSIVSTKKVQKSRNYSGYIASTTKQDLIKPIGIHKLQRTTSYNKNTKINQYQQLQNQLYNRGNYLSPKILQMGQIGIKQKSVQLSTNSINNNNNNLSQQNLINKVTTLTKIRKFQDIANQACIQILSLSPTKKITYQNLLNTLNMNTVGTGNTNGIGIGNGIGNNSYYKQQFIRLKPIRKY